MSRSEDESSRKNQFSRNNNDPANSSPSTISKQKSSQESSYNKNVSKKSTDNDEISDYNQTVDDKRRRFSSNHSDEQRSLYTSSAIDAEEWRCQACSSVNKRTDNKCEECKEPKPMRSVLTIHLNNTKRTSSTSPDASRNSFPGTETSFHRTDSPSPPRGRRASSQSNLLDDDQHHSSRNANKQKRLSKETSKDRSLSPSLSKDKDDNHDTSSNYSMTLRSSNNIEKNKYQTVSSRQHSSRSRSPRDHIRKEPYSSTYENNKHRSIIKEKKLSETSPDIHSSPCVSTIIDESDQNRTEDHYKLENKNTTSNKLYPNLTSMESKYDDDSQERTEQDCQLNPVEEISLPYFTESYASSQQDNDSQSMSTTPKRKESNHSSSSSSSKISNLEDSFIVYVPDLPPNIDDNKVLENKIRECLEHHHRRRIRDVSCNIQLGLGILYLYNDEDKNYLINVIKEITIDTLNNITISLVDKLELISYVVIETKDMKNLPSSSDICQQWINLHNVKSKPKCEQLSSQFLNIFRITIYSLDELINAMSIKEFQINNYFATVYFHADCCFFEYLPPTTNLDRLKEAIKRQIPDQFMSKEFIHIQYNKENANAVVLTSGRARIWSLHKQIVLGGQVFMKKNALAVHSLIQNVQKNLSSPTIQDHGNFSDSVVEHSNRNIYEKHVNQSVARIDDHVAGAETYIFSNNPEDIEIDAKTWYETEMCSYSKADITPFMSNPEHSIFRWKWNSQAFLDQFRRWLSNNRNLKEKNQDEHEKLCNLKRHLLRMTVMLNTIGIVKKGYYRIGQKQIKLKPEQLTTILYDHRSKLQRTQTISLLEATKFPYSSTKVRVVNEDCLIVYKSLVNRGYTPVVLNMANATSPGGGYKRGDGAQEETLFRRSNYYQSLDSTLDDDQPSARFYCNSNSEIEPLDQRKQLYPMDEFGAIYTSGLTVFRLTEDTGYAFMDIPMYDVCAIAMAAYREPKLDNKNLLNSKYSIGTRKKIENIFAIAHQQKHDCLVLSALGCGAFRNPPTHVASIFKSVIEQYAGFFKYIYFSIIDDHNTGQDFNPNGNYLPFQNILNDLDIEPKQHTTIDTMIGPWKILNKILDKQIILSNIRIFHLTPCRYGGVCKDIQNEQHCQEYAHPPLCPYTDNTTSCKEKQDGQHMLWFRHREQCLYGGECEIIENNRKHADEFEHPDFCPDQGKCENMESNHLKSYRHLPLCRYRRNCEDFNRGKSDHCQNFRHCIPICHFGAYCIRFHDEKHFNDEKHPFQPPCPFTPFHCRYFTALSESKNIKSLSIDVQNHCLQYSHVCRFGRQCREKADIHWKTTIHIARHLCPNGNQCKELHQENHLNSFSHVGLSDIRLVCPYPGYECLDRRKLEHIIEYQHHGNHDRSSVINCFGQNKQINFIQNQENIIKSINDYMKKPLKISTEIPKLIKSLQPVYRCGKSIFESIFVHGHIMSREYMEQLKNSSFVAQTVQEHKRVRIIFDRYKMTTIKEHANKYIQAIVSREYKNKNDASAAANRGISIVSSMAYTSDDYDNTILTQERNLRSILEPEEIDTIKKYAIDIAETSWNLHTIPSGPGHPSDIMLDTNKCVLTTLGPNLGHYYGDIILVLKSELMMHPDANFSLQSAISFLSGQAFSRRPWTKDPGNTNDRIKCFHQSKLYCSIPEYEYAAAAELIAITGLSKKPMDIHSNDIFNRWKKADPYEVFEAHLPQLIPLDYIEEIYIPKNLFALLTPAVKESAKTLLRDSLYITSHDVNPTPTPGIGHHPTDKSRADYQDYVVDKLIEKFQRQMEDANHLYGTVITLPPSQFTNHIVLPLTIHDAYNQYRQTHNHASNSDAIYIYWQAMYGDMMITLSDEPIKSDTNQSHIRCLVCYVAERPSTATTNYHESYSYINAGNPREHHSIINTGRCSNKSCLFYRGCNIEDFLTYCLKIENKTDTVTLSHAGSNGIYCYETISHQFSRNIIDLNKLNYIHISAGSQKVPIRNLIVSFEEISDLHPTFDRDYTGEDDSKKSQNGDPKSSSEIKESIDEKSPSRIRQVVSIVGNMLGYDFVSKKREPSPQSAKCLSDDSPKQMKKNSNQSNSGIPCRDEPNCHDMSSSHRMKFSHGEQGQKPKDSTSYVPLGSASAASKSAFDHKEKLSSHAGRNDQRISCRYGSNCHDQNDSQHCSKYSHPDEHRSKSSANFSHGRISCRHGSNCRDQNDSQHCLKFSHPDDQRRRDERIPCKFGTKCYDNDLHHRSKYSHPHK